MLTDDSPVKCLSITVTYDSITTECKYDWNDSNVENLIQLPIDSNHDDIELKLPEEDDLIDLHVIDIRNMRNDDTRVYMNASELYRLPNTIKGLVLRNIQLAIKEDDITRLIPKELIILALDKCSVIESSLDIDRLATQIYQSNDIVNIVTISKDGRVRRIYQSLPALEGDISKGIFMSLGVPYRGMIPTPVLTYIDEDVRHKLTIVKDNPKIRNMLHTLEEDMESY